MAQQQVSSITVDNMAGFDLKFEVVWDGGSSGYSSSYPIDQSDTIELSNTGAPNGASVWPRVHADGGLTKDGPAVTYAQGSTNGATYTVKGTTLIYDVHLNS